MATTYHVNLFIQVPDEGEAEGWQVEQALRDAAEEWSCPGLVEGELLSRSSRHQHRGGYRGSTPQVDRRS
jgi:hypothetical protein